MLRISSLAAMASKNPGVKPRPLGLRPEGRGVDILTIIRYYIAVLKRRGTIIFKGILLL